jgi:hypothetical protein
MVPRGSGLLTLNNVLGIFLLLVLVYRIYRDSDWSFLRSRQVRLVLYITLALVASNLWNDVNYLEQADLGLRVRGQDPMRLMGSRALFLLLFVAFVREPKDFRMMVGLFVVLALATAWSGTSAAMTGAGRQEIAEYRAGGLAVLLSASQNPNRLALFCTLAIIFIWEYGLIHRVRRWLSAAAIGLLVLTVFLSASRGGVVGLLFAAALLFVRRREGARGLVYGGVALMIGSMLISQVVPPETFERLTNVPGITQDSESGEGGGSIRRRVYTYGVAVDVWTQAPILGVGLGNWKFIRFKTDPLFSAASPHNAYLKALAEGGVVTLGLYLMLFFVTVRGLSQILENRAVMQRVERDGMAWVISATRVCFLSFMVFSLFADLWELVFFYLLVGLGGALLMRYGDPTMLSRRERIAQAA